MRTNWKQLRKKIPPRVQVGRGTFEIVWISGFENPLVLGETRWDPLQIVLKTNQSDRETVKTYLHELTHAVSAIENVGLTEPQVQKIEESFKYLLKPGNVFEEKK